jgi:hypothetical protein
MGRRIDDFSLSPFPTRLLIEHASYASGFDVGEFLWSSVTVVVRFRTGGTTNRGLKNHHISGIFGVLDSASSLLD